jgi:hypothetical protein
LAARATSNGVTFPTRRTRHPQPFHIPGAGHRRHAIREANTPLYEGERKAASIAPDDFKSLARRLGADEDMAQFEAKLGKIILGRERPTE